MQASFITTVYNEEKTILELLDSLFSQSVLPNEIVIVDGGSHDNTLQIIKKYFFNQITIPHQLVVKKGNRSVGRNEAIRIAKHEIILCSDAGCRLDKEWTKRLLEKFHKKSVSVVCGYYKPVAENVFEKCLATYTSVMPDNVDPNSFLPSSRSVAFTKKAWETVNGYPENLNTCEDLVFDKKLKKAGFQFVFVKNAIVYWPQKKNFVEAFTQFHSYAKGDGNAFYFRPQTPLLFGRYFILLLILFFYLNTPSIVLYSFLSLGILYFLWAIGKNYKHVQEWPAIFILPALQIISDIAVLLGTSEGILERLIRLDSNSSK